MKLSYNEFETLVVIEREKKKLSQRDLAKLTNLSLGTINNAISELQEKEYIDNNNMITEKGKLALEPYRVKRAIFIAAGFGSRLVPITLNTPKPLVKVHGKRMIETLLDAVVKAEIEEIIIVRGYLGEQFEVLLHKYPNIKFVNNSLYNEANNISSAYIVRDKMENAYVLESDLVLSNENLIRKYEYTSNFLGIPVDVTDDWCVESKNGIITKEKIGGTNCHQMIGISFYNSEDGKKLKNDIADVFNSPGGKEKYWEQVQLVERKNNYKIAVRECKKEDIIEIDTFNELKKIDKTYDV
ncbi:MAG: NTP transferase domain-containing protein [Bacilli bacterium]|jgi:CTP:phosphocholine cytidylyltransferase-like protein/predicted transcriptional regulator|nr:NTP transferase domain-containing protein [Bacilli bacterium]